MATLKSPRGALQLPLIGATSEWTPPAVGSLPSWAAARRVCVDVETRDEHLTTLGPGVRRSGYVVGVSFAIEDGPAHYLPIRHEGGDNLPVEAVLGYLRQQGATFTGDICGANLSYDLDYLWQENVHFTAARFYRDCQIAEPLIDELQHSYSLDAIAHRRDLPGKDEALLREAARDHGVDPKKDLWRLPARYVGPYAEQDARLPLTLLRRQERDIDEQDLWGVYDLESRVLPVLVRMRRRGVRVDVERLDKVEAWALQQETEALQRVAHSTGVRIAVGDVWKPEGMAEALRAIGVSVPKTAKDKDSVRADVLDAINHPVAEALKHARKVNKLRTTFAASVRRYMVGDRLHCTFNQLRKTDDEAAGGDDKGARYGRLSSEDPNLQQQPARDEFAAAWRSIYVPDHGALWASCDYSQQEPRWTTHFAEEIGAPGAKAAAERYRSDPNTDSHDMMTAIIHGDEAVASMEKATFKRLRGEAKIIYLARCYGEGGAGMCHKLGLPTRWAIFRNREANLYFATREEAWREATKLGARTFEVAGLEGQAIIDKFDTRAPYLKKLAKLAESTAKSRGYVKTILGRRCRFPKKDDGGYDWAHKALNRVIQGSGADQMKKAMVDADAEGVPLELQVHDELDFSAPDKAYAMRVAEIMRDAVPARVPFKIDVEVGPSWGEIK